MTYGFPQTMQSRLANVEAQLVDITKKIKAQNTETTSSRLAKLERKFIESGFDRITAYEEPAEILT